MLLSAVEASPEPVNLASLDFEGFARLEIDSHCEELFDRGYIKGEVNKYIGSTDYIAFCLTPEGSAFLESLTTKKLRFFKRLLILFCILLVIYSCSALRINSKDYGRGA